MDTIAVRSAGDALRADDHHDQRHGPRRWRHHGASIAFAIEAKHILTAVIMTAPGTLLVAKMLVPVAWLIGIPWHDATSVGNLRRRRWISLWMAFDIFGISLR